MDELKEEIEHQHILQKEYRKRLRVLEQQAAKFGDAYVPPHVQIEIQELSRKLQTSQVQSETLKQSVIEFIDKELNMWKGIKRDHEISRELDDSRSEDSGVVGIILLDRRIMFRNLDESIRFCETQLVLLEREERIILSS